MRIVIGMLVVLGTVPSCGDDSSGNDATDVPDTTEDGTGPDADADADADADGDADADADEDADADGDEDAVDAETTEDGGDGDGGEPCGLTTFRWDSEGATVSSAIVSGTFNGWAATAEAGGWPMIDDDADGVWTAVHFLDPGTHEYKFVIDGTWIPDPDNPDGVDDGYGGWNSVIEISCDRRPRLITH